MGRVLGDVGVGVQFLAADDSVDAYMGPVEQKAEGDQRHNGGLEGVSSEIGRKADPREETSRTAEW